MAQILSGDPRLGPLAGQGYGGPLAPGGWSPDFSEADPAPLDLTPRNPMAVNYLEALQQALPEAAARYRVSQFQLGTPQPGLIHDVGYGYGGPVGGAVADMLQPPRTGEEAAMMFGMPAVGAIRAYHGSPHDFERFDMSKIGTGEGAQVYGHGLYFAENPAVAAEYKKNLSNMRLSKAQRQLDAFGGDPDRAIAALKDEIDRLQQLPNAGNDPVRRDRIVADKEASLAELQHLKNTGNMSTGKQYEVSINADPEHFLDADKPMSEQPKAVQDAFAALKAKHPKSGVAEVRQDDGGGKFYSRLTQTIGDPAAATEALRAAGIKGIRYKDAGSRAVSPAADQMISEFGSAEKALEVAQQRLKSATSARDRIKAEEMVSALSRTHNYVVFDDKIIDILKKYGLAGLTGGAAATGILSGQPQQRPGT
jgi:hypothetical protein